MEQPLYTPRLVDAALQSLLGQLPGLLITGARATGKTTTARRFARTIIRLDREAEAMAFRGDPDAALRGLAEPVLLDEWQEVPGVLGAVKRAVDDDPRAGRFLLTGSVRIDLDTQVWPGTGRLVHLPMYGLTLREMQGRIGGEGFIERLASADLDRFRAPRNPPDLRGYVELALAGGFPEAVRLDDEARAFWLDSYLEQLISRDALHLEERRDPARLRRCFEVLALNTAGLASDKTLYEAAALDRKTFSAYQRLLTNLRVLELLPAWTSNRLKRLTATPKRYLVDPSMAAAALHATVDGVMRDGDLLGRLVDTFVAAQLRPEAALSKARPRLHHLRQGEGRHEVDLIAELGVRELVGIEVKAGAAPSASDARHLVWLREALGERFLAGAILHTGPRVFALDERIFAVPISCLWEG